MAPTIDDFPDPVALLASTLHLMTAYARTGCPGQVQLILRQLAFLQNYPDDRLPPLLKTVARRLGQEWQGISFANTAAPRTEGGETALLH